MEFLEYFPHVFEPWNLLVLCVGTIGGLILGATPGLSPTMAVALLIPFTFRMDPKSCLILLGAVYTATVAGGAVSAILVNIPGAPANIATVMDGLVPYFFTGGINLALIAFCVFSIGYSVYSELRSMVRTRAARRCAC